MSIIRLESVSLAYGHKPLLDNVDLAIEAGQRLCLLGRNGEGKSTLIKLLTKQALPDSGKLIFEDGIKVGFLPQDLPAADENTAFSIVAEAFGELGKTVVEYSRLLDEQNDSHGERLSQLQDVISEHDAWHVQTDIDQILKRFGIQPETQMKTLSGGWRRRVLLAAALVQNPDILLLDEPTNHLDINTIRWIEEQLKGFRGAVLFVSHDRAFIKALASSIIELDRGKIRAFQGSYENFLVEKEKLLEEEAQQNKLFDKRLSEEETWIRQGIKARRTRNEGRVRALKAMRNERKARLDRQGTSKLQLNAAEVSGKRVIEAEGIGHAFEDGRPLIKNLHMSVIRGDRIGLIGANGAGKTTLLRILLGRLDPAHGSVKLGSKLEVAYFDQLREGLDPEKAVFDNVADGHEYVELNGKSIHVMSYLNDFLFTSERARSPVKALSGGETNRLLLAKLFAKPANLLVMDEPTNDLDVETLELLEEKLSEYPGTLLLTSHDRDFLDQVVTSTLVFEGKGRVSEYVGGYQDWVRQTGGIMADESTFGAFADATAENKSTSETSAPKESDVKPATPAAKPAKKKLSYKLQRELDMLPEQIANLEDAIEKQQSILAEPSFYEQDHQTIEKETSKLGSLETELEEAMERWVELESELES